MAALAVLGYRHAWENANVFLGVRNVNEDFFTSDATSFFVNSSCGIFPTIAVSYPIANYPFSGLTVYFDVSQNGWTFRNSLYNIMVWATTVGAATTIPFSCVRKKTAFSTFRNWNIPTATGITSQA